MQASDFAPKEDLANIVAEIREKLCRTPTRPSQSGPPHASLYAPLSEEELAVEEVRLGFALPTLLRRLYTEVGNGGFGPGAGLLCVKQISPRVDQTIATLYSQFRASRAKRGAVWQVGLIPFAHWGDFIFSCLDLSDTEKNTDPPVVRFEPNMSETSTHSYLRSDAFRGVGLIPERDRLSGWFYDWLSDREMFRRPYIISKEC